MLLHFLTRAFEVPATAALTGMGSTGTPVVQHLGPALLVLKANSACYCSSCIVLMELSTLQSTAGLQLTQMDHIPLSD